MIIPTLVSFFALFLSLFCAAVNGMPTPHVLLPRGFAPEPKSLLGRNYIRHGALSISQPLPGTFYKAVSPDSDIMHVGPIVRAKGRAQRFHAIQNRLASGDRAFGENERRAVFHDTEHS